MPRCLSVPVLVTARRRKILAFARHAGDIMWVSI